VSRLEDNNLARLAELALERRGDYEALLFEGRWHTSAGLHERAARLAGGLTEHGVAAGDRIVVCMANCPEVGITYHAVWRAGAVVTPAMFLLPVEDLRHVIADAGAVAVVTTAEFLEKVLEAAADLEHVRLVAVAGGETAEDERAVALAELEAADPRPIVARSAHELAALLYTGGTTGRAKGVMLSHESLSFTGRAAHRASYVEGVTRALVPLPLAHAYGILLTMAGLHAVEPPVSVLQRWFDPDAFLALIAEQRVQQAAVVPTMLQILLGKPIEEHDLTSLLWVTSGGAPLPPEIEEEFCRRVPGVSIRQGYGLTETAALISTNPVGRERRGSVGLPVPGVEVRITGEDGRELARGEVGEICARSPGVMQGYWNSPQATAETLQEGWLHTGDVGRQDEDGYLYIVDRKKDLIIRGGFNVYPRDVEDALVEHPAVQLAAVVGRPHPRTGEEVVAFVSLLPGAEAGGEEIVEWARGRIGGYKYPREVHVVEQIPLTPVGKVDRKALRVLL
jgi:long-chain acyl-CoA synthetase